MRYACTMRLAPMSWVPFVVPLVVACSKPVPPTLAPERVQVTALTATHIDLKVAVAVSNPNGIDLVARNLTAHVMVSDRFDVGTVDIPVTTTFPANKTTRLEVPLSVKIADIAPMAQLAVTATKIPYSVDGTVGLGGDQLHVEIPYRLEGSVPRDQVVRAAMAVIPGLH